MEPKKQRDAVELKCEMTRFVEPKKQRCGGGVEEDEHDGVPEKKEQGDGIVKEKQEHDDVVQDKGAQDDVMEEKQEHDDVVEKEQGDGGELECTDAMDERVTKRQRPRERPCLRCGLLHSKYKLTAWIVDGFDEFDCNIYIPDVNDLKMDGETILLPDHVVKFLDDLAESKRQGVDHDDSDNVLFVADSMDSQEGNE